MNRLHRFFPLLGALVLLGATALQADSVRLEPIEYHDGDTVLEGWIAYDSAVEEPRPGVMIVHEWTGVGDYVKERARMLAEMGYVAFAADIYGKGVNPESGPEAAAEAAKYRSGDRALFRRRLALGLEQLAESEQSDSARLAAIGYCFGGTGVLELARSGADVRGVVSFHGGLSTPSPEDAQNIRAEVLVCHGAVDPLVPPDEVQGFIEEMEDAGVTYTLISYSAAVHSFTNPDAGDDPSTGAAYQARADRESWEDMRRFLSRVLE